MLLRYFFAEYYNGIEVHISLPIPDFTFLFPLCHLTAKKLFCVLILKTYWLHLIILLHSTLNHLTNRDWTQPMVMNT